MGLRTYSNVGTGSECGRSRKHSIKMIGRAFHNLRIAKFYLVRLPKLAKQKISKLANQTTESVVGAQAFTNLFSREKEPKQPTIDGITHVCLTPRLTPTPTAARLTAPSLKQT